MRYLSVCSGIEAATVAWKPLGWTAAGFAEIDKFPSAVLAHHYGSNMPGEPLARNGVPNFGDFTTIKADDVGPIDLLVGGTPCQSFSLAGLRGGLDDDRGNLALEYMRLADRCRPRWLVWENVPGVLSSNGGRDFGSILGALVELGYGFFYRALDAQYVRVDGYPWAVPQRRARVFVVGYLGDCRRAAAVLLEPEALRGDSPPRREAGQGIAASVAPSLTSSGRGVERPGESRGQDPVVAIPFGGNNTTGPIDVATARNAHAGPHGRLDFETETFVAEYAPALSASNPYGDNESREGLLVAHTLKAEGFDASEDGTGRGTPIVPIAFSSKDYGGDAMTGVSPTLRAMGHTDSHPNAGGQIAVAYDLRGHEGGSLPEGPHDTANIRASGGGSSRSYVFDGWAVRRLTPLECERLQGFPEGYTIVPGRGYPRKDYDDMVAYFLSHGLPETEAAEAAKHPDGPRYKALGNSMAVNVMRWIGRRIEAVEQLSVQREGKENG